ncbi:zinc metalloprotease [Mesoterricola sediminis]|uniref:Zincin peptidase n=1 Tax=Mesoterricola sediminis TaxID=2927980 RepID=A0AA48H663_9BACT|nr:metalloprotease family protein [Mesoterricola sediminis]BDU78106.1 hypothetical protein METESE_30640 [Mesoterricola sediminis]
MMIIPGFVVSIVTFPGVVVHEAAHLLFCRLCGIQVHEVCFFRVGNPSGYVVHDAPSRFRDTLLICAGPLFLNTVLCLLFCLPAFIPYRIFGREDDVLVLFQLWLGVSIGMHAFPSTADARILWDHARTAARRNEVLAWFSFPLVGLIWVANLASFFWFDLLYGVAVGVGLPTLILDLLN